MYHIKQFFLIFIFIGLFFLVGSSHVHAAQLFVNVTKTPVEVGETFQLRVGVNSEGTSINNSEATISFPSDLVQITAISTNSSIFDLWVDRPEFSNTTGTITFNGGITNPGFSGSNGTLFWITAKAKKTGTATFALQNAAVRANDGLGTDVLSSTRNVPVTIIKAATPQPKKEEVVKEKTDTTSPDTLSAVIGGDQKEGKFITLSAHDDVGIDHFSVSVDGRESVEIPSVDDGAVFNLPVDLSVGVHNVSMTAFDKAGNTKTYTIPVTIDKTPLEITNFPREINLNGAPVISGVTEMPNKEMTIVVVFPSKRLETYLITTDASGKFNFSPESFTQEGKYTLWIQTVEVKGIEARSSDRIFITVSLTQMQEIMKIVAPYLPWIGSGIFCLFFGIFAMHRRGYRVVRVPRRTIE